MFYKPAHENTIYNLSKVYSISLTKGVTLSLSSVNIITLNFDKIDSDKSNCVIIEFPDREKALFDFKQIVELLDPANAMTISVDQD